MEALDIYDYVNLRDYIRKNKRPLLIKRKDGQKVAIVLTREAKIFYQKRAFQAFVLEVNKNGIFYAFRMG